MWEVAGTRWWVLGRAQIAWSTGCGEKTMNTVKLKRNKKFFKKGIYRFNELSFKILVALFIEAGKYPKVYMESQRIPHIQSIPEQEEQSRKHNICFEAMLQTIVIKQYGNWNSKQTNRLMKQY